MFKYTLVIIMLVVFCAMVYAQDVPSVTTVPSEAQQNVDRIVGYVPAAAGLVLVLTSITKRFLPLKANIVAAGWMVVVWAVFLFVQFFDAEVAWVQGLAVLTQIGYALLGLTGTAVASSVAYDMSKKHNVPLIGNSKTPEGG